MLVTVPFVLLLLDYWPLRRLSFPLSTAPPLHHSVCSLEKAPFFTLSAASCVVTVIAQQKGGAVASLEGASGVSLEARFINTPISYVWYLVKLVWPSDLAVIYPYVRDWPMPQVLLATALLIALTGVALWQGRRWAYLAVGWLWYLGNLGASHWPGQSGHTVNCRPLHLYTGHRPVHRVRLGRGGPHCPLAEASAAAGRRRGSRVLVACALVVGGSTAFTGRIRKRCSGIRWRSPGITIWPATISAYYYAQLASWNWRSKYYRSAMEIAPSFPGARNNLGAALVYQKQYEEAVATFDGRVEPQSSVRRGGEQPGRCPVLPGADR